MGIAWLATRARKRPVVTGTGELIGLEAVALQDFKDSGRVHVRGEDWRARSGQPVRRGQRLCVRAVDGLVLHVEPLAEADGGKDRKSVVWGKGVSGGGDHGGGRISKKKKQKE